MAYLFTDKYLGCFLIFRNDHIFPMKYDKKSAYLTTYDWLLGNIRRPLDLTS
jgi:hypothetical protein